MGKNHSMTLEAHGARTGEERRTLPELGQHLVHGDLFAAREHRPGIILHFLVLNHSSHPQSLIRVDVDQRQRKSAAGFGDGLGRRERPLSGSILGYNWERGREEVGGVESNFDRLEFERGKRLRSKATILGDLALVLDCEQRGASSAVSSEKTVFEKLQNVQ